MGLTDGARRGRDSAASAAHKAALRCQLGCRFSQPGWRHPDGEYQDATIYAGWYLSYSHSVTGQRGRSTGFPTQRTAGARERVAPIPKSFEASPRPPSRTFMAQVSLPEPSQTLRVRSLLDASSTVRASTPTPAPSSALLTGVDTAGDHSTHGFASGVFSPTVGLAPLRPFSAAGPTRFTIGAENLCSGS